MNVKQPQARDTDPPIQEISTAPRLRTRMVTPRAVLLAMLLMPLNAYWIICMEVVRYSGHPTTISLFFNVVFILTVLHGLNALVRRDLSASGTSTKRLGSVPFADYGMW